MKLVKMLLSGLLVLPMFMGVMAVGGYDPGQRVGFVPETLLQGEDLRVSFPYDAALPDAATYYRFDGVGQWQRSPYGGVRIPNVYEAIVPANLLFDHDYVEFYVTPGDPLPCIYRVDIQSPGDVRGIRTSITDGETLGGTVSITANDGTDNANTRIYLDGVSQTTIPMLEDGAYFTFLTQGRDSYFKNAITTTDNAPVADIGKWQYANTDHMAIHIDSGYFTYDAGSYTTTLRIWAGTMGTTVEESLTPDANRDDFQVTEMMMKLGSGSYLPTAIGTDGSTAYDAIHEIGDSDGRCPYMDVTFTIPGDAVGLRLDTTALSDGAHTLKVTNGESTETVTFLVDNTALRGVTGSNAQWDGTAPPEDYDFAFAWLSDTQGYVQSYPQHYTNMTRYLADNAQALKLRYVLHTGDLVDDWDATYQWENADAAMDILDEAGIPYGVLGGNHDVAAGLGDNENYQTYFGEARVQAQPTFGGSYENNLGHYDLISQDGEEFIIVYMSWNVYDKEIRWINRVLAEYSHRKAILCFHTYTGTREQEEGLLDYYGVMLREHVVKKNPNVIAVLNGHYSGASYQTVRFDDDGDGEKDRTVYQICTDYQGLREGGGEYIKFLYFDLDSGRIYVNAYSPYYDDYNYYDGTGVHDLKALARETADGVASAVEVDALVLDVEF